ncbi:MAG: NUDIX hydrolase [Candidatus Coproplasma sp.]
MDIKFKNDDFIFSYRVGGILVANGKILLQRPKNQDYSIIGGHVSSMETSIETLKREFEEELHTKVEVENLFAVGEIFFPWGKKPCHQISLYYTVRLTEENIPMDGEFHGYDDLDNERIDLDFCWVPLQELQKGVKIYPTELIPHILQPKNKVVHFISKQI